MDNSSRDKFIFVLALAVFAAAVLAKLNSPLLEWDDFFLEAAKSWASGIFSITFFIAIIRYLCPLTSDKRAIIPATGPSFKP